MPSTNNVQPDIGLDAGKRQGTIQVLSRLRADEYVPYTKTRNYHRNVTGPRFHQLHEFFKVQYGELDVVVDDVAERSPQLGGRVPATLNTFKKGTRIEEDVNVVTDANAVRSNLLAGHENTIKTLRTDSETVMDEYGDAGTNDFPVGLMEQHGKMA